MKHTNKIKKSVITTIAVVCTLSSVAALNASAASKTFDLFTNETSATDTINGNNNRANIQYVKNYSTSDDGVNMYLDCQKSDGSWLNKKHIFTEPGYTYGSETDTYWGINYSVSSDSKTNWRGVMNSFWINGKNIRARAKFHAYS